MSDRYPSAHSPAPTSGRGASLRPLLDRREPGGRIPAITEGATVSLGEAVLACLHGGLGVLFAPTSDAGAISVTLYDGGDRLKSYASNAVELEELLIAVRDRGDARSVSARAVSQPVKGQKTPR